MPIRDRIKRALVGPSRSNSTATDISTPTTGTTGTGTTESLKKVKTSPAPAAKPTPAAASEPEQKTKTSPKPEKRVKKEKSVKKEESRPKTLKELRNGVAETHHSVYLPGEKLPQPKYRRTPEKAHKEKLEAFSWTRAWRRRRSDHSQYSPMASRAGSVAEPRKSFQARPAEKVEEEVLKEEDGEGGSGQNRLSKQGAIDSADEETVANTDANSKKVKEKAADSGNVFMEGKGWIHDPLFTGKQLEEAFKKNPASVRTF